MVMDIVEGQQAKSEAQKMAKIHWPKNGEIQCGMKPDIFTCAWRACSKEAFGERARFFQEDQWLQLLEQERSSRSPSFHQEEETSHGKRGHEGGTSENISATSTVVSSMSGVGRCRGGHWDVCHAVRIDQP